MNTPSSKVTAAAVAAAAATILLWIAQTTGLVTDVPAGIEAAFTTLLTLVAGYVVPERNPSPSTVEYLNER